VPTNHLINFHERHNSNWSDKPKGRSLVYLQCVYLVAGGLLWWMQYLSAHQAFLALSSMSLLYAFLRCSLFCALTPLHFPSSLLSLFSLSHSTSLFLLPSRSCQPIVQWRLEASSHYWRASRGNLTHETTRV